MMYINQKEWHKFVIQKELESRIGVKNVFILKEIGLPRNILSNKFNYFKEVLLIEDEIYLGNAIQMEEWILKINIHSGNLYMEGKGDHTEFKSTFINSSLEGLITCVLTYEFYMKKLIDDRLLGDYHENHEKYAKLLSYYVKKIDEKAGENGVWWALIDDMDVGIL